jgi:site-specific recombinase XerD
VKGEEIMKISEALGLFRKYQKSHLRPRTLKGYKYVLSIFEDFLGDKEIEAINEDEIYQFLDILTENLSRGTRRLRYAQIKAFFNFSINHYDMDVKNPCNATVMKKLFPNPRPIQKRIIPKEIIDEAIFNSKNLRDRLILEL